MTHRRLIGEVHDTPENSDMLFAISVNTRPLPYVILSSWRWWSVGKLNGTPVLHSGRVVNI